MRTTLALVREGGTDLYIPRESVTSSAPETYPVFFNPAARTNRDVSVSVARATAPRTFLDALTATGARGIRVAVEGSRTARSSRIRVTLVDFNRAALSVARRNVKRNGLASTCEVVHSEAVAFMTSRFERDEKFESVDVDPFGSPAPYIQAALMATADGGTLSFTATDAAVLCGVYPAVSFRRYGASSVRSEFVHETGLRILLGFAVRMGGVNDIGVEPLLVHSTLHYLRAFVRVKRGALRADRSARQLGYVTQCNSCYERWAAPLASERCTRCGGRVRSSGPLWVGQLSESEVLSRASDASREEGWSEATSILAGLQGLDGLPPFSYSLEAACSQLKVPSASPERLVEELARSGFKAVRQTLGDEGLKTDASYREYLQAVAAASGSAPR